MQWPDPLEPGHFTVRGKQIHEKGATDMEQMVTLISELGFPIVVTLFLLNRIEAKLDVVVSSIQGLPDRLKE